MYGLTIEIRYQSQLLTLDYGATRASEWRKPKQIPIIYHIAKKRRETPNHNEKEIRYSVHDYSYSGCAFASFKGTVFVPNHTDSIFTCELFVLRLNQLMNSAHNLFCLVIVEKRKQYENVIWNEIHEKKEWVKSRQGETKQKHTNNNNASFACTKKKMYIEANCLLQLTLIWTMHLSCGKFALVAYKTNDTRGREQNNDAYQWTMNR